MSIAPAERSARMRFVSGVAAAFDRAGISYVFLHGYASARPESDIDVAVASHDRELVDLMIRAGTFGRLVQRVHYDIPWCLAYVVKLEGSDRRYRQLDVACDPWGISRLGPAVPLALAQAQRSDVLRTPEPGAEACFLAVKRACEGLKRPDDARALADAFARDPAGAQEHLTNLFGNSGTTLAVALAERRADLSRELHALRRTVGRGRLAPRLLPRLAFYACGRTVRRITRPRGLAVALVGPDGTGKSTLAARLAEELLVPFRRALLLHLGPGLLPPPARLLGRRPAGGSEPHGRSPSGVPASLARLLYLWLDAVLGWWPRVALPRIRVSLVLLERGWLDLAVDQRRYRLSLPSGFVRALGRPLPRPDLTLLLDAPAPEVHRRKPELEPTEIERQLAAWHGLADARFAVLDASQPADRVVSEALRRIEERTAMGLDLGSCSLLLSCLGGPVRGGEPYVLVRRRWLLPSHRGGPRTAALYRPASARHAAGAAVLEGACRLGFGLRVTADTAHGLAPVLADALGKPRVELAAAVAREGRRVLLAVRSGGRLFAYAKVDRDNEGLEHERQVLTSLATVPLERIAVPEVLAHLEWNGCSVLVLAPLPAPGRADRPFGPAELAALAELARLGDVLGTGPIPVHGDFAPWNCAVLGDRLALWDWEETRAGLPFEDLFHWQVQRLLLFGVGSPEELVARALEPDTSLCAALGASPSDAPAALRGVLEHDLERGGAQANAIRRRALALLEGARV